MSSDYKLLCLNHDPALVIEGGDWHSPEPAIAAALEPQAYDWLVEDHGKCELLVGRFSYPLVEVCCPASRDRLGHGRHCDPKWMDRDWLVLLSVASAAPTDAGLTAAIKQLQGGIGSCWSWDRLNKLRVLFGFEA